MQRAGGPTSARQSAGMARSAALLLWAQALGLTGAQPSQLTLDPPWTPVFLTEKVTLTCQGSGAPGPAKWYVNEQFWQQARSNHIHITTDLPRSYSLQCRSPGARLSPSITLGFSNGEGWHGCPCPGTCGCHKGSGWALFLSLLPLV
ncbi:PREDICTED: high affinity immunoglobulin epsilon receptor subunit alpha-like isoform X2 [Haliaeetus leucocephalus]|uniref:high affinity immunoglobulin epsilon receptor subunit alpha-like isoform X2 n=1 Tax=Haliaeetus leucocephalus TaxID=52644 RepID=UPI00053CE29D|nr:PREDICTED: high affinity immunoglobulin epsilon receptor subunit alpha-like isoform X2 [Haliaeetus leucocephalus]